MDGLESYLVLEDDAVFDKRSCGLLRQVMAELPDDWGQLYLGGQHLKEPELSPGTSVVYRCHNVNRTHAYALHKRAMARFQQHVSHAPDYIARGSWHLDHQLGVAHERGEWPTYATVWWLAGQEEGASNISGRRNPRLWWHLSRFSGGGTVHPRGIGLSAGGLRENPGKRPFRQQLESRLPGGYRSRRLCRDKHALRKWLAMIAREAMDMGLLPGIQHHCIPIERVNACWSAGVQPASSAEIEALLDYPYNGLFPHPLNAVPAVRFCVSSAA